MAEPVFGSCCKDLADAMSAPPNSFLHVADIGVLYLAVGYAQTERGPAFFDQAIIYCPFCGTQVQDRAEIARKAGKTD